VTQNVESLSTPSPVPVETPPAAIPTAAIPTFPSPTVVSPIVATPTLLDVPVTAIPTVTADVAAVPKPAPPGSGYDVKLNQLEEMGFTDRRSNVIMLVKHNGDMLEVVKALLGESFH